MAGLIAKFQQAGLGEQMQSWIGSGANQPVSGAQMQQALGGDTLSGQAPASGLGGNADLIGMLGKRLIDATRTETQTVRSARPAKP